MELFTNHNEKLMTMEEALWPPGSKSSPLNIFLTEQDPVTSQGCEPTDSIRGNVLLIDTRVLR